MAYDEALAERVRDALPRDLGPITEKKMFGGLAFLLQGHVVVGIVGDSLLARIGTEATERALTRRHVREMNLTGRPSRRSVLVEPPGLKGKALNRWIDAALTFHHTAGA